MELHPIIEEFNTLVAEKFDDFKGCHLYGKNASLNFAENKNIDLIAMFETLTREKKLEIYGIACDLEFKYNVFFNIHPFTEDDLTYNPYIYSEAVKKGMYYAVR